MVGRLREMHGRETENQRGGDGGQVRPVQVTREHIRRQGGQWKRPQHDEIETADRADRSCDGGSGKRGERLRQKIRRPARAELRDDGVDVRLSPDDLVAVDKACRRHHNGPRDDQRDGTRQRRREYESARTGNERFLWLGFNLLKVVASDQVCKLTAKSFPP